MEGGYTLGNKKSRKKGCDIKLKICMSPKDYKESIIKAEENAKEILLLPKRLTVMFKSQEMIEDMAQKRFGEGSPHIQEYVNEHMSRKVSFIQALNDGCKVYEIHNITELETYLNERKHVGIEKIDCKYIIGMLEEWKNVMLKYENYYVALTKESVPIKYELVNEEKLILHESTGVHSDGRMNALFITSKTALRNVKKDFFAIWERTDNKFKNTDYIVNWINEKIKIFESEKFK